jgi:hypothetical protein
VFSKFPKGSYNVPLWCSLNVYQVLKVCSPPPPPNKVIPNNTTLYPISFAQSLTLLQGLGFRAYMQKPNWNTILISMLGWEYGKFGRYFFCGSVQNFQQCSTIFKI